MKNVLLAAAFTLGVFLAPPSTSQAVVLDWDTNAWTPEGALVQATHDYDVDPGYAGPDVRVNISGYIGQLYTNSPRTGTELTGGFSGGEKSLIINTNHAVTSTYVTITIDFYNPAGVLNPTFSIYDIDVGGNAGGGLFTWQDQISNIQASYGSNTFAPTFSNLGSAVSITGPNTLQGNVNVNETDGAGNATITFNGSISRIQFDYRPGPSSISDPDGQVIGLSDINFNNISGVPEINTVWVALGALILAGMFQKYRQRQNSSCDFCFSKI